MTLVAHGAEDVFVFVRGLTALQRRRQLSIQQYPRYCALAHPQLPSMTRYLGQGQKGADTTRRVEPKQMEGWQDVSSELLEEGILGLYIYVCCQTLGLKL